MKELQDRANVDILEPEGGSRCIASPHWGFALETFRISGKRVVLLLRQRDFLFEPFPREAEWRFRLDGWMPGEEECVGRAHIVAEHHRSNRLRLVLEAPDGWNSRTQT